MAIQLKLFSITAFLIIMSFVSCKKSNEASLEYKIFDTQIKVVGQNNMRDFGGHYGANGKRILYRKLFRSGDLSKLTTSDLDTITKLGIKQVIDLRTTAEISSAPDKLPAGISSVNLPLIASVSGTANSQSQLMGMIMQGTLSAEQYMLPIYNSIDSLKETNWHKIFSLLQDGTPTIIHCTAGKDRAGMTSALILCSLGVDKETIIGDFMASNQYLATYISQVVSGINAQYGAGAGNKLIPLLGVEDTYIYAFFDAINVKYGSMDNFLIKLGVDKARMRSLYLEQ